MTMITCAYDITKCTNITWMNATMKVNNSHSLNCTRVSWSSCLKSGWWASMWITQGRAYSGKIECEQAKRKQRKIIVKSWVGETGLLVVVLHYIPEQIYCDDHPSHSSSVLFERLWWTNSGGHVNWKITCLAEQSNVPDNQTALKPCRVFTRPL